MHWSNERSEDRIYSHTLASASAHLTAHEVSPYLAHTSPWCSHCLSQLGHGTLFDSWYANNILGFLIHSVRVSSHRCLYSLLTSITIIQFILVPFFAWKASHNAHHVSKSPPFACRCCPRPGLTTRMSDIDSGTCRKRSAPLNAMRTTCHTSGATSNYRRRTGRAGRTMPRFSRKRQL